MQSLIFYSAHSGNLETVAATCGERRHLRSLFSGRPSSSSPVKKPSNGSRGGKLSYISIPLSGLNQLREKWEEYKHPRNFNKKTFLFVSHDGDNVVVASENQITILRKDDNYREPCGNFTSDE